MKGRVPGSGGSVRPVTWGGWRRAAGSALMLAAGAMLSGCVGPAAGPALSAPYSTAPRDTPTSGTSSTPGSTGPSPGAAPSSTPAAPPRALAAYHYVFPVGGKASYAHTHHDYPASDIIAACGLPVRAAIDG